MEPKKIMLETRPIQEGDMDFVMANPYQESAKNYPPLATPESTHTYIFDGEIVAVGGIIDYYPGVGEAWLMLTKQSRKHGIFGIVAFGAIEKHLNKQIADHKIRTCTASARADFPEAITMLEALGFEYEGTRREFTPDFCDLNIYSRLIR